MSDRVGIVCRTKQMFYKRRQGERKSNTLRAAVLSVNRDERTTSRNARNGTIKAKQK